MPSIRNSYDSLIDRLSRVTTSGRRIRELDGLRFIAIFTVIIQHVYEVVVQHFKPGTEPSHDLFAVLIRDWRIGVDLFFVISGFILAMPFAAHRLLGEKPVSLKAYYWRRVTRLEPPYLLTLLIWYAVLVLYWHQSAREQLPHLLASAVYLHNIIYRGPETYMSTINSVAWSLEIEVQFYIIAPLLALVFALKGKWIRRGLIVAVAILSAQVFKVFLHFGINMPLTVLSALPMFLMGFLIADVFLTDWDQQPQGSVWGDLIAIPGWLLLPFWFQLQAHGFHGHRGPTSAFCFILLILCWASFRSIWMRKFLASSFIMTVGGMCYSIYLLHFPMLRIMGNYSPVPMIPGVVGIGINTIIYLLAWGIPVLAVSIAFFLLVEKPCMRKDWPQRLLARLRGESIPGPAEVARPTEAEQILDVPPETTTPLSENQPVP